MRWREFADRFLLVRKCAGCRQILAYENCHDAFCPACRLRWSVAKTETCPTCHQSAMECTCQPKGLKKTGVLSLRKLYFYKAKDHREPQNQILYRLKHERNKRMSAFLAAELSELIREELKTLGVEELTDQAALVALPRGRAARLRYGVDQSEEVARAISEVTEIPFLPVLSRRRRGREQKRLSRSKRFQNMKGSFALTDADSIRGRCVILLDDVVTTGASMAACAPILKKAGASHVLCVCIAYTLQNPTK